MSSAKAKVVSEVKSKAPPMPPVARWITMDLWLSYDEYEWAATPWETRKEAERDADCSVECPGCVRSMVVEIVGDVDD